MNDGKLNCKGDWQEDPCQALRITMGCQLEILMLTEMFLTRGIRVVSQNTKCHWCSKIWLIAGNS